MGVKDIQFQGCTARLMRLSFSGELAYEVHVSADYTQSLWEHIMRTAEPLGIKPYGLEALAALYALKRDMLPVWNSTIATRWMIWALGTGGQTSERGADSATARAMAVLDRSGRVMVLMTHNTDIGDSFEREADDPRTFSRCRSRATRSASTRWCTA